MCYLIHKVKYEGGAREYREEQCLNFDTETGELVKLEDVLPPASLALLPSLLTEELLKTYGCRNRKELQDKGILRLTDIYIPLNYELGKEGITFIYNADEIAAYEVGAIRLTLPYSRLETHTK